MKFSIRFFSSLYISLLCASVSSSVLATQTEKPERWFEIEIILFKQLGDKKGLKEQFSDSVSTTNLPQHKKHFDLLSSYLQPNLKGIKQFMPLCGENNAQNALLESFPRINTPFPDAIKAIEHLNGFSMPEFSTENETTVQQREFVFDLHEELASPLFSTQNICIISRKDIENLFTDEQLAYFPLDIVDVDALPTKLNAVGAHISDSPYLIADKSLLLADIKQRLEWSREFKPLLHFGWRQIGVSRNKAIPLKLFAGNSLDYQYLQALNSYQSALDEATLAEQLNSVDRQKIDGLTAQREQKKQQLTQIFNELDTKNSVSIDSLISDMERQTLEELIVINEVSKNESVLLNINNPPVKPLQPWFLDGFFKVHLDHYLYITADFNVLSQSLDESTHNKTSKPNVKLINFSQTKRAITGEIHYFDHPYIGMIVQIRRFDPSKPIEEAVTQVVNQ
ncbi:MAG: CsiV family protein [Colwellia sp.]|nr:CsiV family protein [Colwellia sp.]